MDSASGAAQFSSAREVLRECVRLNPAAREEARAEVRDLLAWRPVVTEAPLLELGWKYQDRYHLSYWDSLIVAAAKTVSCGYLLTEDLQAGQRLDEIEILNPFAVNPQHAGLSKPSEMREAAKRFEFEKAAKLGDQRTADKGILVRVELAGLEANWP